MTTMGYDVVSFSLYYEGATHGFTDILLLYHRLVGEDPGRFT